MHISENCIIRGYGEQNPHQDCRKVESHEVSFELLRRNLLYSVEKLLLINIYKPEKIGEQD